MCEDKESTSPARTKGPTDISNPTERSSKESVDRQCASLLNGKQASFLLRSQEMSSVSEGVWITWPAVLMDVVHWMQVLSYLDS